MQSSAASPGSTAAAASTAPVYEFVCLFTHDLRRKQKRWQDGRLKYHTYNNRIMVHDDRGNFVGDTHWREDYCLDDGEEITLDRGGVIVQVNECVATRTQDLSEIVDKRLKEKAERQSAAAARQPTFHRPAPSGLPTPNQNRSLHHQSSSKPLEQVVGTPTGHYGRALIPKESPFEQRQKLAPQSNDESSPAPKRQKRAISPPSKSGYAQSLFGATLSLSSQPQNSAPLRVRPANTSYIRRIPQAAMSSSPAEVEATEINARESLQRPNAPAKSIATGSMSLQARGALPSLLQNKPQEILPRAAPVSSRAKRKAHLASDLDDGAVNPKAQPKKSRLSAKMGDLPNPRKSLDTGTSRNKPIAQDREESEVIDIESSDEGLHSSSVTAPVPGRTQEKPKPKPKKSSSTGKKSTSQDPSRCEVSNPESNQSSSNHHLPLAQTPMATSSALQEDHPTTELRIKPRKKRGLLMLTGESVVVRSNARDGNKSSAEQHNEDEQGPPGRVSRKNHKSQPEKRQSRAKDRSARRSAKRVGVDEPEEQGQLTDATLDQGDDSSLEIQTEERPRRGAKEGKRKKKTPEDSAASPELVLSDADVPSDIEFHLPEMRQQAPCNELAAKSKPLSAPRLARFARRDIRSKEIIGFNFDDDNEIPELTTMMATNIMPAVAGSQGQQTTDAPDNPMMDIDSTTLLSNVETTSDSAIAPDAGTEFDDGPPQAATGLVQMQKLPQSPSEGEATTQHSTSDVRIETQQQSPPITQPLDEPLLRGPTGSPCQNELETSASTTEPVVSGETQNMATLSTILNPNPELSESVPNNESALQILGSNTASLTPLAAPNDSAGPNADLDEAPAPPSLVQGCVQGFTLSNDSDTLLPSAEKASEGRRPLSTVPRLVNPATRGRKAAKPSDAAGQTPQCPLPADTYMQASTGLSRMRNMQGKPTIKPVTRSLSDVTPIRAPAFTRANGGPWSREAHDLFDYKRPI